MSERTSGGFGMRVSQHLRGDALKVMVSIHEYNYIAVERVSIYIAAHDNIMQAMFVLNTNYRSQYPCVVSQDISVSIMMEIERIVCQYCFDFAIPLREYRSMIRPNT